MRLVSTVPWHPVLSSRALVQRHVIRVHRHVERRLQSQVKGNRNGKKEIVQGTISRSWSPWRDSAVFLSRCLCILSTCLDKSEREMVTAEACREEGCRLGGLYWEIMRTVRALKHMSFFCVNNTRTAHTPCKFLNRDTRCNSATHQNTPQTHWKMWWPGTEKKQMPVASS